MAGYVTAWSLKCLSRRPRWELHPGKLYRLFKVPTVRSFYFVHACLVMPDSVTMDDSLPGSSVLGILQVRRLEWVAITFSRGSFRPRERTHCISHASCIAGELLTTSTSWEALRERGEEIRRPGFGWGRAGLALPEWGDSSITRHQRLNCRHPGCCPSSTEEEYTGLP